MLYTNYTDRIKSIVSDNRQRKQIEKAHSYSPGLAGVPIRSKKLIAEQKAFSNVVQLNARPLGSTLQSTNLQGVQLGIHPDFKHLKYTDDIEYHYIVSVFIDIQGSTNLHKEYGIEDVFRITNTVQTAALQTCIMFGGHVQRLQGDGVFAYFGGKSIDKKKAVEMALIACSMFSYFIKNDLKNVFLEDGIEDINTRIGIDIGNDDDVLWANFGLMDVSELTTLSIHTSSASKMQAYAYPNGIVVGQNIKDTLNLNEDMFDLVRDAKGEVTKRYIYEDVKRNFRYTQYAFDWFKFLKTLPFVGVNAEGSIFLVDTSSDTERLNRLRNTSKLITSGNAYLDRQCNINSNASGVRHEPHRFHHGK